MSFADKHEESHREKWGTCKKIKNTYRSIVNYRTDERNTTYPKQADIDYAG